MDDDKIYVRFRGRTLGPLTNQKVQELIRRGQITRMHELSGDGLSWVTAEEFGNFFAVEPQHTPQEAASSVEAPTEASPTTSTTTEVEWYAHVDGENKGPMTLDQVRQWKNSGTIQPQTLMWQAGLDSWEAAQTLLPELFVDPFAASATAANATTSFMPQSSQSSSSSLTYFAAEFDRRRGWIFFFAITLIVLTSFQIVGQLITIYIAASGASATGVNAGPALVGGTFGIAIAGTVMTIGILLLQYCGKLKDFALRPTDENGLLAARAHSRFWAFTGITTLIWLVVFMSFLLLIATVGLSALSAFR